MRDIIAREGVTGLYDGLTSSLIGIALTNGYVSLPVTFNTVDLNPNRIYYYFYERSRGVILASRQGGKGLSALESILAGLIAGTSLLQILQKVYLVESYIRVD